MKILTKAQEKELRDWFHDDENDADNMLRYSIEALEAYGAGDAEKLLTILNWMHGYASARSFNVAVTEKILGLKN